MPQILASSFSIVTLKFSIHNFFETRVLLKIFDIEFPYKCSYFEQLCLPTKMARDRDKAQRERKTSKSSCVSHHKLHITTDRKLKFNAKGLVLTSAWLPSHVPTGSVIVNNYPPKWLLSSIWGFYFCLTDESVCSARFYSFRVVCEGSGFEILVLLPNKLPR